MFSRAIVENSESHIQIDFVFVKELPEWLILKHALAFVFEVIIGEHIEFRSGFENRPEFAKRLVGTVIECSFSEAGVGEGEGAVGELGILNGIIIHADSNIFNDRRILGNS